MAEGYAVSAFEVSLVGRAEVRSADGRIVLSAIQPIGERLFSLIDVRDEDKCWPFLGRRDDAGYGQFRVGGRQGKVIRAHRVVFCLVENSINPLNLPSHAHILHSCDNPPCCNPLHLFDGDHQMNMEDCSSKHRNRIPRPGNGIIKITSELRAKMIEKYPEVKSKSEIARLFNISRTRVRQILVEEGVI